MSTSPTLGELDAAIEQAMSSDRFRLRRQLGDLRRAQQAGRLGPTRLEQLAQRVQASIDLRQLRQDRVPAITYPADLPITARREEIAAAIREHPVVIVCGDTGSGKSTQLPKICLELGRGVAGLIGHTQPRRLAARTIASRLAQELQVPLGEQIGYKIRFADRTRPETLVKLMTDGILLAETQHDRFLNAYDTILIDEAHERSLNIDFLLGYLQRLMPRRPDLRLIITSATLDAARFQQHFGSPRGPAPLIEVSGRTYPVEVRYRPLERPGTPERPGAEEEADPAKAVLSAVDELLAEGPGDILLFLPTERDIRETAKNLRGWGTNTGRAGSLEILPLYARLSAAEQERIFAPRGLRRIVLATNVAESSLTVPGIRYVIDTGTARVRRYSPSSKVERLPIEAISQASAEQRKGRCGRLGPGICIRLYSEDDYLAREPFTTPEIRRSNLAAVILQTKVLGLGAIEGFPFLDPPRPEAVRDGYKTLFELGAIDEERQLTDLGRALGRFPVDPRIGRMVLAAEQEACLHEVLIIASALEIQDPRERPVEKQQAADEAHRRFAHEQSDFLTLLKVWDFYHELRENLSRSQLKKACAQSFLSLNRLREWAETHRQLKQLVEESGRRVGPRRDDYGAIHRALMTGLLSGIAYRTEAVMYTGAGGGQLFLWPGSVLFGKRAKWIMAAELVETTRRYARTVAQIDPDWIEPLALHLVKRRYVDPFWSRRRGSPMVYEKVSLFGLPIVARRPVPLGPVDPDAARQMFIEHALVQGDCAANLRFLEHNQRMLRRLQNLAAKTRQSTWFVAEAAQVRFYLSRLPKDICDLTRLRAWLPDAERAQPGILHMRREDFFDSPPGEQEEAQFPDELQLQELRLPLEYHYAPGEALDGVTVSVPKQLLPQLQASQFEWLVPGRLEEKIVALIRTLPKPVRRHLVPAPETAHHVAASMAFGEGPFLKRLAKILESRAGAPIAAEDFRLDELPSHLRMNFRVLDETGQELGQGRDFEELVRRFAGDSPRKSPSTSDPWRKDGLTAWSFGDLPEAVETEYGGIRIRTFPTLIDRGTHVDLRLMDSPDVAREELRHGLRRLFALAEKGELRTQVAWLPRIEEIRLLAASWSGARELERQLTDLIAERAFVADQEPPRSAAEFQERRQAGPERIAVAVQEIAGLLHPLFAGYHAARKAWEENRSPLWEYASEDVGRQLQELMPLDFLAHTAWQWLKHYPRYFQGIVVRFERLRSGAAQRDRQAYEQLAPHLAAYRQMFQQHRELHISDPELEQFRWMLEEYRISLFAQPMPVYVPVSDKRLAKQWDKVRR